MDNILKHTGITDKILNAFFKKVYHRLGYGFLEKVYETRHITTVYPYSVSIWNLAHLIQFFIRVRPRLSASNF